MSQNWVNTHTQIDGGRMDGFLFNGNTNAMRYWDGTDLPFYYSLAHDLPDVRPLVRLGPGPDLSQPPLPAGRDVPEPDRHRPRARSSAMPHPAGGTIWDKLNAFGITWNDYAWDLPDIALFQHTYAGQRRPREELRPTS